MPALPTPTPRRDLLWLLLLWCAACTLVNPLGDFPLNDDWAYGQNVRALSEENRLFFSDWPAMTLIAHTLWGALFCKIFGFSFTVLRLSTLALAAFGLAGFYQLLRRARVGRETTWVFSLALAFNPFWFVLANSFMTDVPFLAATCWSVLYFLKTLERPSAGRLAWATFFALWACFIRQLGLVTPVVFMLLVLYSHPLNLRTLGRAVFPAALCYAAVEGFAAWLDQTGRLPQSYAGPAHLWAALTGNPDAFAMAVERMGITLLTIGLFLLPVLAGTRLKDLWRSRLAWLLVPCSAGAVWAAWQMFPKGNIFYNLGLGPKLLKDAYWGVHVDPALPEAAFGAIKVLAVCGALLLAASFRPLKTMPVRQEMLRLFCLLFCLLYLVFVCANSILIDRYLFPFIPFLLLYTAPQADRIGKTVYALLGLWILFSVAATHDYLAWNRARWQAARQLERTAGPGRIDGGFEYNGWYGTGGISQKTPGMKSWWFVGDDEWVVAFGPVYGYETAVAAPYRRWLPPGRDTVFALRRLAGTATDSVQCDLERLAPDSSAFEPVKGNLMPGNNGTLSSERARSGRYSIKTTAAAPFGAGVLLDTFRRFDRVVVSVWRYPADSEGGIVITADAETAYFFENTHVVERDSAGWGRLEISVILPEAAAGQTGKCYLWNPSPDRAAWFDDLMLYRYRAR